MPLKNTTDTRTSNIVDARDKFLKEWNGLLLDIKTRYERLIRMFWYSEYGFSPLEMATDVLGWTLTVFVFGVGSAMKGLVARSEAGMIPVIGDGPQILTVAPEDQAPITIVAPGNLAFDSQGNPTTITASLPISGPEGAAITVNGITQTISNGLTTFTNLPDGTYSIGATLDGWQQLNPVSVVLHKDSDPFDCGLTKIPTPPPVDQGNPS